MTLTLSPEALDHFFSFTIFRNSAEDCVLVSSLSSCGFTVNVISLLLHLSHKVCIEVSACETSAETCAIPLTLSIE